MTYELTKEINKLADALNNFINEFCNAVQKAVEIIADMWKTAIKELHKKYARLCHLAIHAKKARTRKKNMQRIYKKLKCCIGRAIQTYKKAELDHEHSGLY